MTEREKQAEALLRTWMHENFPNTKVTSWHQLYPGTQRDWLAVRDAAAEMFAPKWLPIESAPRNGTSIWALLRDDIYPSLHPARDDLTRWNGLQIPLRHPGLAKDGFDIGWNIAAPVGYGGFPDEWIAGWISLIPIPPETDK